MLALQHVVDDGPAYLATWLAREGIAIDLRCTEAGDDFPATLGGCRALAILGGPMSANDDLPSLRRAEDLIRQAFAAGVPVIGHCLGGQLMARALGAAIGSSSAPEIGWQPIAPVESAAPGEAGAAIAQAWLGPPPWPKVFQWHYEAFALPLHAVSLATSAACRHQAFAVGPHLAMQFHVEVDAAKLERWSREISAHCAAAQAEHQASVQSPAAMLADAPACLAAQQRLADRLYRRWISASG